MKKILAATTLLAVFATSAAIFAQPAAKPADTAKKEEKKDNPADEKEAKWYNPDYRPYVASFDELYKLGDDFANNKFRLALSNYQTGRSLMDKMREEVQRNKEEWADAKYLNEKWYWQTIDRKMREERILLEKKNRAKIKAVTYFTRAINHLDEIQNRSFREKQQMKDLTAAVYRDWIIAQYDLGNLPQTIDLLERYLKIDPAFETEISPHKYLASAYGFKEAVADKYNKGTEA
ncbi:MAG TPA: hypothetical protein PKY99_06320, partial [Turneriella sp.]|nr:hypothetical protein [Turneriella sp.]